MTGKFQIHLAIPTQVQFLQHKLIVLILLTGLNFLKLQTKWANGTCPFCDPVDFKPKFPGLFIYYVILFYLFIFFVQMANTHCTLAQGIHSSASTLLCFYMCTCKNTGWHKIIIHVFQPVTSTSQILKPFCVHSQEMRHDGGTIKQFLWLVDDKRKLRHLLWFWVQGSKLNETEEI